MKNSYIKTIVPILFLGSVIAKFCDNSDFGYSSIETFCTRENGLTADCRGSLYNVKKAYVKCKNGYYNEKNITLQELECSENGKWSNKIMECIPECVENAEHSNRTLIPKCNLNIKIKRLNDSKNVISLQIHELISKTNLFAYLVNNSRMQVNNKDNSIMYPEFNYLNQICFNKTINRFFEDSNYQCQVFSRRKCLSDYDDPNVESICFRKSKKHPFSLKLTKCKKQHDIIMVKCRIGTRIKITEREIFLGFCFYGAWDFKGITCENICGQTDKDYIQLKTPLMYKGIKTDISLFPWHVAIFKNSSSSALGTFEYICGGTIIHSNIIISAAHCFYNNAIGKVNEASKYLVGAGKNYRNYHAVEKYGFFTGIEEIQIAKNYYSPEIMNDISILILKEHLTYSSHIKPACIHFLNSYDEYFIKSGIEGHVAGWGRVSEFGDNSDELLTIKLTALTMDQCKHLVNVNIRNQIVGDKFCAVNENNATACPGDSGGGFVVEEDLGYGKCFYLKGIVSTSINTNNKKTIGNCYDGYLTVFTNIQFYQNFIKSIMLRNQISQFLSENVTVDILSYNREARKYKFRTTTNTLLNKSLEPEDVIVATGNYADADAKLRATSKILLNKRLEPGDVITATGYYADANVQVNFNLENGKCDFINGAVNECMEYSTRLDFKRLEIAQFISEQGQIIHTIHKFLPTFVQKRKFKYSIKVKKDCIETCLDDQNLSQWYFNGTANTFEIFSTYGAAIIETFKVEYGYSTFF